MGKELWRNRWLSCINEFTSLNLQRQAWVNKRNSNPHWSFVEFMSSYFDDLGIDNNYEYQLKQGWVTRTELDTVSTWHQLLYKYNSPKNDDYDVEAILCDKNWLVIIEEGEKAKNELCEIISDEEKAILFEKLDHQQYL